MGSAHREPPEDVARRLMREGRGDEEIERLTGLSMLHLLSVRARAAVEDRSTPSPLSGTAVPAP